MKVRKAALQDAKGIARVHIDSWLATYRNIIPGEYIDRLTYEKRERLWEHNIEHGDVFVAAEDNGEIIGFADGGKERTGQFKAFDGELYAIYIRPGHEKKGAGKALLKAVANHLLKQGFTSVLVWVLKDNPSKNFYEKLGGRLIGSKDIEISGKRLTELAYGWREIDTIQ
ncbi:GNAT family N-acetyltransferase [Planococcus lenghuensis]|uniref:GNAT family N-acetyltransferase n=1 Tax=Planococcus lenghuensis TaxID=2213202 RepID=A0A1Q2L514_9BACL|nr:GNAT family N-acetyltransferase [Planococcus lenghuensis]AQQ55545.1 GNAT family N-acetyltransferase [Planococcus lenghuensis]